MFFALLFGIGNRAFLGSTFTTAHPASDTAKRTVCKERLFSYNFLNDSTYVRVCQNR